MAGPSGSGASLPGFRNRIINGNFRVNQRGAVAASTAYAAGAYVMDRWKAGAGGCTLSFAAGAGGDVTLTITAGTLQQVIEGSLYLPEGGAFVLSWAGTAQARLNLGAYGPSPATAGLGAGANLTIEFGTGTVSLVQLEAGNSATVFERRDDEISRCKRYYRISGGNIGCWGATTVFTVAGDFAPPMASAPTVTVLKGDVGGGSATELQVAQRLVTGLASAPTVTSDGYRVDLTTAAATAANKVGVLAPGTLAFNAEL